MHGGGTQEPEDAVQCVRLPRVPSTRETHFGEADPGNPRDGGSRRRSGFAHSTATQQTGPARGFHSEPAPHDCNKRTSERHKHRASNTIKEGTRFGAGKGARGVASETCFQAQAAARGAGLP
ncbi:hypothetical protein MRX96_008394 [Rhipicephalus microplus]